MSRSLSLETLKGNPAYFVTIQAVRVHGDKAHVSPMEMASIIAPNLKFTDKVNLTTTGSPVAASSTVRQQAVNVWMRSSRTFAEESEGALEIIRFSVSIAVES